MPLYIETNKNGDVIYMCGDLGPHCAHCAAGADYLCDYPVGDGKTCDAPLCRHHGIEVAPEIHYCPGHLLLWERFRAEGGVEEELKNVRPFPGAD